MHPQQFFGAFDGGDVFLDGNEVGDLPASSFTGEIHLFPEQITRGALRISPAGRPSLSVRQSS
jgi:hypothetical protein